MKMRRIPETDLARIAVLPVDEQPKQLQQLKAFRPPHTLNPFRSVVGDLVNLQFEMLGERSFTRWDIVSEQIRRLSKHKDEFEKNLAVAKALHNYCIKNDVISYSKPTPKWGVGFGNSIAYWSNFYSVWGGRASFLFFDPRISHPLTKSARKFAFSLMHQRLRVDDPDFADAELLIVRFGVDKEGGQRTVAPYSARGVDLFGLDDLNAMIETTYQLWAVELERRAEEAKRAGGGSNPFGF